MKQTLSAYLVVSALVLLPGVSGCQRSLTDESAASAGSESDREETVASSTDTTNTDTVAPESLAAAPSAAASASTDAPSAGVERPSSNLKPVPAHIPLPEGAVLLGSTPLSNGKHFVRAQYPDATDLKKLLAQFEEGLAEHGWTANGEPASGVVGSLGQLFERENEKLSVNCYSKPDKSGLFVQIELESQ